MKQLAIIFAVLAAVISAPSAQAVHRLNDQIENRPYTDLRPWHLGFSIGSQAQDLRFAHNGFITPDGEQWRVDQINYQPGFSVSGLIAFRLNTYFSLRFSPGMMFGSRDLRFVDLTSGAEQRQNLKTTYLTMPVDLKFASQRANNVRPYLSAGIMPAFDITKKRNDLLKLTTNDFYVTVAMGCDCYLPYFKLIPELKFCFGLSDVLQHNRPELAEDPQRYKYTQSIGKATSKLICLTFYFE